MVRNAYRGLVALATSVRDGFFNDVTGIGTGADKAMATQFVADGRLQPQFCFDLFHHNGVAKRILSLHPNHALSRGFYVKGPNAEFAQKEIKRLGAIAKIKRASIFGGTCGGSILAMKIQDGRSDNLPVAPGVHPITALEVYDRRLIFREHMEDDPTSNYYGKASIFRIQHVSGGGVGYIHRSRCLIFGGAMTGDREIESNAGWDYSRLQAGYEVIRDFMADYKGIHNMLADASVGVLKLTGLLGGIGSSGTEGNRDAFLGRLQLLDLSRSIARAVLLDADEGEDFTRTEINMAGIPEVLDRVGQLLCATYDIPATKLLGISPAGMNATGASDQENLNDSTKTFRETDLEPLCVQLVEQIAGPGHEVGWPALGISDPVAQSVARLNQVKAAQILMTEGVITPKEERSRVGGQEGWKDEYPFLDPDKLDGPKLPPAAAAALPPVSSGSGG